MKRHAPHNSFRTTQARTKAAQLVIAFALLFLQTGGYAVPFNDPLKHAMGFLITGDYLAVGVNLTEADPVQDGLSVGNLTISDRQFFQL